MNGRKARSLRRQEALTGDLKRELKAEVAKLAGERSDAVGAARKAYRLAVEHAKLDFQKAERAAWTAFEQKREPVVAAFSARAAERTLAAKLEVSEVA